MNSPIATAVRAAFERLVDYAGLFPPARLSMSDALTQYRDARSGPAAWMLGRYIVAASRASEAAAAWMPHGDRTLPLSVVVDADADPRRWFGSLQQALAAIAALRSETKSIGVDVLEVPLPPLTGARETFDAPIGQLRASIDRAGLEDLPVYVELPSGTDDLLDGAMQALARTHLHAKIRCGGITAQAFPSVASVAGFVQAAATNGVTFKATAGLHHPVRHRDATTGWPMHGFLNLLAAAVFAPTSDGDEVRAILGEEDPTAFAFDDDALRWRERRAGTAELARARSSALVAYGSCSFREPVDDLTALGILPVALA